jgi:hypothetical protein
MTVNTEDKSTQYVSRSTGLLCGDTVQPEEPERSHIARVTLQGPGKLVWL